MKLLAVNVSMPKEISYKGKTVRTGIFKEPVDARVKVNTLNIEGDGQADLVGHGGEFPVVLLSAGVGLTPLMSMLNAIVDTGSDRPTWFVHGSRNGREHAMGAQVRRIAQENSNVQTHIRYSRPGSEDLKGRDYDDEGHVDSDLVKNLLPGPDFDFYLCGPTPFMKSLFTGLLAWGVSESRLHYEFFGPASALDERAKIATPKRAAEITECCEDIEVTFAKSGIKAHWNPSFESILDLAEANGLSPDYSCRSGICHTCMCRLEAGEVDYVLEPLELPDQGSLLICCSKPTTPVVVDL